MHKRGQGGGLITGLVFGVASLVIGAIIAFVIVSTLVGTQTTTLLSGGRISVAKTNETAFFNTTGDTVTGTTTPAVVTNSFTLTSAFANVSGVAYEITSNVTLSSAGVATNATAITGGDVNATQYADGFISYTFNTQSAEENSTNSLSANFTQGVNNVSGKLPTVLLIAAIVLLLSILAILVGVWAKMRMGNTSL